MACILAVKLGTRPGKVSGVRGSGSSTSEKSRYRKKGAGNSARMASGGLALSCFGEARGATVAKVDKRLTPPPAAASLALQANAPLTAARIASLIDNERWDRCDRFACALCEERNTSSLWKVRE